MRTLTIPMLFMVCAAGAAGAEPKDKPPLLQTVLDGYERVVPSDGGERSLYTLYYKKDTEDLLAVLPKDYEQQRILLTNTLAGGFFVSGIQSGSELLYWKRYGNRMALMMPQLEVRTTGDEESRRSRQTLFPDSVRLDMPIVAVDTDGAPVIDLDDLFIDRHAEFHRFTPAGLDTRLGVFSSIKAMRDNLSLSVQMPWQSEYWTGGPIMTLTFSISTLPAEPDYTPREADPRVGYFHTSFDDLARVHDMNGRRRYIKRWKLEKAAPELSLSPPRHPIVFYIDHKTPIRYRRWVRDGILEWNRAFEAVGYVNAIEVYQQDVRTGAHMEKGPEDVNYNFVVWNSNDVGFAIGPSRVDPRTGQILDADVVFNDGWIRAGFVLHRTYLADIAIQRLGGETRAWLESRPRWDPRQRLAGRGEHPVRAALEIAGAATPYAASPVPTTEANAAPAYACAGSGLCQYGHGCAADLALARLSLLRPGDDPETVPDEFVGPLVKDVIMHEIGHVLGLRHNFKGSTLYGLDQIISPEWRAEQRPVSGSIMDYNATNLGDPEADDVPRFMSTLGPYDVWAIRYGYADDDDLESILAEATRPEHAYLTDEDLYGPDPAAQTSDLGADVLQAVDRQMALVQRLRARITERALREGESWQRARDAYMTLLGKHAVNVSHAAAYVGGVHVYRNPYGTAEHGPTKIVEAEKQRRALTQVVRYAFRDESYGLSAELLNTMTYDKWMDGPFVPWDLPDPQLDVHDLVLAVQASTLTMLLNPTRLRRVHDNEHRIPPDQDAFTLAELLDTVHAGIWSELDDTTGGPWAARSPRISSLRRNLQREHLERLIDIALSGEDGAAATMAASSLCLSALRRLGETADRVLAEDQLDPYTVAHLQDVRLRVERALEAVHVYE